MRFALINDNRIEAQPQLQGSCCCCSKPVIAKCGTRKIWHWAHKSKKDCDHWWEPETAWHRWWKDHYPSHWQEITLPDERTGEKHIADIRTDHNLVIEFQHSHIDQQERTSREKFYKNMVWVVDGTRLKRDYPRFWKEWEGGGISDVYRTDSLGIFEVGFPEFCFPEAWCKSAVPVIFDFRGDNTVNDSADLRHPLYCLFPQVGRRARVAEISRTAFIKSTTDGEWTSRVQEFISNFFEHDNLIRRIQQQQTMSRNVNFRQLVNPLHRFNYKGRRRRF